jgi:hypothetical protein
MISMGLLDEEILERATEEVHTLNLKSQNALFFIQGEIL